MKISNLCKNYFIGFQEISNAKKNKSSTNALAVAKIISYFTVLIPLTLTFAALYGIASLCDRVSKKNHYSLTDKNVRGRASQVFNAKTDLSRLPKPNFSEVLSTYKPRFRPRANHENLLEYSQSKDFQKHAKTAKIYYNGHQLAEEDALRVVFQREPTNIAMGSNQYDEESLEKLFGYRKGIYNDSHARKKDGSSFKNLPNSAAVYSETYIWDPPGGKRKKEVACLSVVAPPLDSPQQPLYRYYVRNGRLDAKRYEQETGFIFKAMERAVIQNKDTAFGNKGIKRLVLSPVGLGAFLGSLSLEDKEKARNIYKEQLAIFLDRIQGQNLEVVMSQHSMSGDQWPVKAIIGDIIQTAQEGDLIINAWDPHSAPGNGNDGDPTFDGAMGKASGILLTQTSWLNQVLRDRKALVACR